MYSPSPVYDQTSETAFSERVDPYAIIIWRSTDWLSSALLPLYGSPSAGNVRRAPKSRQSLTAPSTKTNGSNHRSQRESGVWVSVGPRRWLHLPIWPQPRRPSTFRLLSSRDHQERRQVPTNTGRRSWSSVKTQCPILRTLTQVSRALGTDLL